MALLALGFRPFYLLAGAYAALAVPVWVLQYSGWLPRGNLLWHAHEMIFGYAFAVIAGFLLTAVRNWTGRPTPSGAPLALLAAVWVAARLAAPFSLLYSSVLDAAFALGLAWGIGVPILASRNRNGFFILLVLALGGCSLLFPRWPGAALALGLDVVLFVIAVMAGRVVPMFTNNAVPGAGARRVAALEVAALGSLLLLILLDAADAEVPLVPLGAALLHAARLALWAPLKTRGRPILWILHLSYAWLVVHLALRGLAGLDLVSAALPTHALTVGAIGGITLGMMTRTARGHTGRPLDTGRAELAAYLLVQAAAVARVLLPIAFPGAYLGLVFLAGALWSAAFLVFTVAYFPILARPRADGRPG